MSIVTLITDFGRKDYYVALLKGAILSAYPELKLVDVSHDIRSQDIMEGAFYLRSVFNRFPPGTIHVCVVNNYYSKINRLIFFEYKSYFFIGPNNGLFSLVFPDLPFEEVFCIDPGKKESFGLYDAIGECISFILQGSAFQNYAQSEKLERRINLQAVITSHQIRATIIHVDHFGNVIVNLDKETFEKVRENREFAIYYKSSDPVTHLSHSYGDVPIGDVCVFFNSIGMLEIAVNMGNAHKLLSLNKNETIQINFL